MKLKVSKGELIISNGLEMADDYLPGGVGATPPALVRVNNHSLFETSNKFHEIKLRSNKRLTVSGYFVI